METDGAVPTAGMEGVEQMSNDSALSPSHGAASGVEPVALAPLMAGLEEEEELRGCCDEEHDAAEYEAVPDEDAPLVMEACLAQRGIHTFPLGLLQHEFLHFLDLSRNHLKQLPEALGSLQHLVQLTISHNSLITLPKGLAQLSKLVQLDISNNSLQELPSTFGHLGQLQMLYAGGNEFEVFPEELFALSGLKRVYLGGNHIAAIGAGIANMASLEILYLGGNMLETLPDAIEQLHNLSVLYLGDNRLRFLPRGLGELHHLRILNLHNNALTTLPLEVVGLTHLHQLSLRGNPLVTEFVSELPKEPLSLLEICARTIKMQRIQYERNWLPAELNTYLDSGCRCSNPDCSGVYFTKGVKSINFVDFCGRYRVPLMKFLCSPCHEVPRHPSHDSHETQAKIQRVLLGGYVDSLGLGDEHGEGV